MPKADCYVELAYGDGSSIWRPGSGGAGPSTGMDDEALRGSVVGGMPQWDLDYSKSINYQLDTRRPRRVDEKAPQKRDTKSAWFRVNRCNPPVPTLHNIHSRSEVAKVPHLWCDEGGGGVGGCRQEALIALGPGCCPRFYLHHNFRLAPVL